MPVMDIDSVKSRVMDASKAYYEGDPLMPDEEYDSLVAELAENGVTEEVASGYTPSSRKVSRDIPLLSLSKAHTEEDIRAWLARFPSHSPIIVEPKWDGLAVELRFSGGELALAATRGDGYVGEDITEAAKRLINLPSMEDGIAVGEVVMDREKLAHINSTYEVEYLNTRNATAGIIRRMDQLGYELASHLRFVPHDKVSDHTYQAGEVDRIMEAIHLIGDNRLVDYDCDIDGAVVKILGKEYRDELGSSSHSPRWAIAYKFVAQSAETIIRSIEWNVGRTGKVVPVAIFDPIVLAGATITNATLHNVSIVKEFDIHYGDVINVQRSGDVIPYIVGVNQRGDGDVIQIPTAGEDGTEYAIVGRDLVSLGGGTLLGKLTYAIQILGIDGIGPGTISSFIENGLLDQSSGVVDGLRSMLTLTVPQIEVLDGFGPTSANLVVNAMATSRDSYLYQWIASLGISGIGRRMSTMLVGNLGSLEGIISAEESALIELPGLGWSRVETIVGAKPLLENLRSMMDEMSIPSHLIEEAPQEVVHPKYTSKNVVVTGTVEGWSRNEITEWLISRGAAVQGSVTMKTDILVSGEKAGSKLKKATELGIKVVSGSEWLEDMDKDEG